MAEDWLQESRYSLAIGSIVLAFVFVIIVPIWGYLYGIWSSTLSRLLMVGVSGLGTILLATLTFITLLDNRILVQERLKERDKPLQQDMLAKIVWPAIDAVDENQQKIRNENFNWIAADYEGELELVNIDMEMIAERGDPVTSDRFVENYPEVAEQMRQYDKSLMRLDKCAYKYIQRVRKPMSDYIHAEKIQKTESSVIEVGEIEDLVEADAAMNYLLIGDRPSREENRPKWWANHKQEFKKIAYQNAEEYCQIFKDLQTKVVNDSNDVRRSLVQVREDIETEYGIYRE